MVFLENPMLKVYVLREEAITYGRCNGGKAK